MITWENYEEYMMMHADGELQAAETQELMEFVNQNPQLKSEMADLELVRMVPDTIVYANKVSLLKPVPAKIIAFPVWKRYSIAAAALLLVSVVGYRFMNGNNNNVDNGNTVAVNKVAEPVNKIDVVPMKKEIPAATAIAHTDMKEVPPAAKHTTTVKQQAVQVAVAHQQKIQPAVPVNVSPTADIVTDKPMQQLQVATVKAIPVSAEVYAVAGVTDVPEYTPDVATEDKTTFWDKLPVDDIKKKQLSGMAEAIKEAANQKLSVKIEKRKLILSF